MKTSVKAEVRRFAKERDAQFDSTAAKARAAIAKRIDPKLVMRSPEKYLRALFIKVGGDVVKGAREKAKKIGREHAERMGATRDSVD